MKQYSLIHVGCEIKQLQYKNYHCVSAYHILLGHIECLLQIQHFIIAQLSQYVNTTYVLMAKSHRRSFMYCVTDYVMCGYGIEIRYLLNAYMKMTLWKRKDPIKSKIKLIDNANK